MSATLTWDDVAKVRKSFATYLFVQLRAHEGEYIKKTDPHERDPVKANKQEAEVLRVFLSKSPLVYLMTGPERRACAAMVEFLDSFRPPLALGLSATAGADEAESLAVAMKVAEIERDDEAPWGPRVLQRRLEALGFEEPGRANLG